LKRITSTLDGDLCTVAELFSEREIFQKSFAEKIILYSIIFPLPENRGPYVEKYGKVVQARDDNIIRRSRFACCTTEATNTHSEF